MPVLEEHLVFIITQIIASLHTHKVVDFKNILMTDHKERFFSTSIYETEIKCLETISRLHRFSRVPAVAMRPLE